MHHKQTIAKPWLDGVRGTQVLPIIEDDSDLISVEAGPGTGKTFGLMRRVHRLTHPEGLNVSPEKILIVAFNRVIAKELGKEIGESLANLGFEKSPVIRTVHALCLQIIGGNLRILLEHERKAMLYDILMEYPKIKKRLPKIKLIEKALISHEAGHKEDYQLWQGVNRWLSRHNARLISELPNLLLDKIKGGDFGDRSYSHVIVDEYQDLTKGLQELVFKIWDKTGTFMALGDSNQSIYAFLRNDPEGLSKISELVEVWQDYAGLTMTECQRCPTDIVKAANQLMVLSDSPSMVSLKDDSANIHLVIWESIKNEAEGMAEAIVSNFRANPNDSHLIMVTRQQFGRNVRDAILELDKEIYVDLSFSESLLGTWIVREAFLFYCLVFDQDPATWRAWFSYKTSEDGVIFNVQGNSDAYLKFLASCEDNISERKIKELAESTTNPPGNGGKCLKERATRFFQLKEKFSEMLDNPSKLTDAIFNLDFCSISEEEKNTSINDLNLAKLKIHTILEDVSDQNPKKSLLEIAKEGCRILRYQIATKEPLDDDNKSIIKVTTLWGAKGITADHVYVIGLCNEALPGERREEYPGTKAEYVEEQRRLFYVSITRSKKTMVLSRATKIKRSDADKLGLSVNGTSFYTKLYMSDFLREIINFLPDYVVGEEWKGCKPK